ncbi:hypothetical protein [Escherichia coli]|uniref:hypothetical protein n=1 Tax=Escherichia coli TaxID=562 RepID=UPI00136662EC|nr:hypothetical protein [Escherichia coli]MWF13632.1 hypothetical protein [Escherichia coli]
MHSNNNELVSYGHKLASAIGDVELREVAQVITALATQLDVTTAALRAMTKNRDAEHSDVIAWEKTMFKVCGEDGIASVADKFRALQSERDQLAAQLADVVAENAALKNIEAPLGSIENGRAFADRLEGYPFECEGGNLNMCSDWQELRRCFEHLSEWAMHGQSETPATDSFIAEQRAVGVEMFAKHIALYNSNSEAHAKDFAAQLRNEVKV